VELSNLTVRTTPFSDKDVRAPPHTDNVTFTYGNVGCDLCSLWVGQPFAFG